MSKKIAIVLFNLGGPDKSEDIKPFLRNLFSDKSIIDLPAIFRIPIANIISTFRAPKAKPLYDLMGGGSPLLKNTIAQSDALLNEINSRYKDCEFKIFIAMRYWHPFIKDTAKEVLNFAPDETILLPLYPHYSMTTTGSSWCEWTKYSKAPYKIIKEYPVLDGLVATMAGNIMYEYEKLGKPEKVRVLFSAHGLPKKIIEAGDPYEVQINQTAEAIKKLLPDNFETVVCYQSKVGPLEWLGPSTPQEIERAGKDNIGIIINPIAFVSDHIETLVELDVEYKELAHELNVPFFGRAAIAGTNPKFIKSLADLVDAQLSQA